MTVLDDILQKMNGMGRFQAAILASSEGLPIAGASSAGDASVTAAMVALLQGVGKQTRQQLGLAELDEMILTSRDRRRLVCRYFAVDADELILAVMVEPGGYYRNATSWAMREIDATWRSHSGAAKPRRRPLRPGLPYR